ncbi:hypothetical protein [Actinokineospora globicatena]|uniref:Uncharacterized protein n=1 Tax=Actinokineospora globicatena TaxID=103729 RepID=A0A9W6QNK2_9PSEU|nr:hypothetical protein [Actinokineospora globicatena]GLW92847.1 hypothetical protein Aglo03_36630 [Actinokineospora globicatena]
MRSEDWWRPGRGCAHPVGTPDFPLDERQAGPFSENRPPSPGRRGPQEPLGRRQPQPSGQFPIADQGRRGPDEQAPMGQGRPLRGLVAARLRVRANGGLAAGPSGGSAAGALRGLVAARLRVRWLAAVSLRDRATAPGRGVRGGA